MNNLNELIELLSDDSFIKEYENECNSFWDNLSSEEKLKAFCMIIKKLSESELLENRSYRGILYDKFNFDINSYILAQNFGFLELHNSIYTNSELLRLFKNYFEKNNINFNEEDIKNFLLNY